MKIKNVLVTGASGKIGRSLVPALIAQGYKVRAVQYQTPVTAEGAEVVKGTMTNRAFIKKALEGMDAICHLATSKESDNFFEISLGGMFSLLDESHKCGHIEQFILAGGDGALGIVFYPNPYPLDENAPLKAYPGYYAFSKVLEETMCNQYFIQYGLPITIPRFSWIHDQDDILAHMTIQEPGFGVPVWKELAVSAEQKSFFEKGQNAAACMVHPGGLPFMRHIVALEDVVQAFLLALGNRRAIGQTFNIAAPSAFTYDVLSKYVSEKLDIPVVTFEQAGWHDFSIDISKARSILGYKPQGDVFQMVDQAIEFRKQGKTRNVTKYQG